MAVSKHILLIIGGGIAAYKAAELIRLIKKSGMTVRCVLTESGAQFVTPMTLAALSENEVHTTLWSLKDETEMGHIQLSREADLIVICPATANLLAKMVGGIADDLATTLLLATDAPVLAVPAMNVRMWQHAATQRNIAQLRSDGIMVMHPDEGDMACGEYGPGRLPEPESVMREIVNCLSGETGVHGQNELGPNPLDGQPAFAPNQHRPLRGKHVLVTAGPTHEPIDPVRYIANRSSGRQGFAIAAAAADAGARVTLVAGPVHLPTPAGVMRIDVETAVEMEQAVHDALPADVAIMVAAVADWRADSQSGQKIKKDGAAPATLKLTENPDILAGLARHEQRPALLIGFAAETEKIAEHAKAKLEKKSCDWIVANDVSGPIGESVMGGTDNSVHIVTGTGTEIWERLPKMEVARRLIAKIGEELA
ncbi:MAG: bifunctional phosphopantothenoylcysteine decarboxylase/phosphopantothenate synthase [Sphingomonadales bacterium]|nr:bifunctional phosphopantothenoylcysteine decarboxylase/phosphopantothenate synthase [Sphingomonadales bacterium]PIX65500.1 MAG: bifunctional phosphopantothenoylcysteine decarboxylase/phosphopantothenate synthase [Sphingomonadales bacterium CG_4_10_14_3_um_filter_58_15]NCO49243.1 bifunctional phosphopantothenoylcysteine decarboxylase/phosphopantothenate synthase [Sphingomonadales bacterium]NCP01222.1 bifunctional phosphopantothenoylcysteine decarboxylase/phosphopantothenate synthase [Sphingomo